MKGWGRRKGYKKKRIRLKLKIERDRGIDTEGERVSE